MSNDRENLEEKIRSIEYLSEISDGYWLLCEKLKEKICSIELIYDGYWLLCEKLKERYIVLN